MLSTGVGTVELRSRQACATEAVEAPARVGGAGAAVVWVGSGIPVAWVPMSTPRTRSGLDRPFANGCEDSIACWCRDRSGDGCGDQGGPILLQEFDDRFYP